MTVRNYKEHNREMKTVKSNSFTFDINEKSMANHKLQPDTWVDLYADYLYNYTIARVSDAEIAKDLVQETFLAGLKSAKNYKGDAAERTWLIAILKRKVIDHYRKINSKKGKAEVRMNYSSQTDAEGDWLEEQVADLDGHLGPHDRHPRITGRNDGVDGPANFARIASRSVSS